MADNSLNIPIDDPRWVTLYEQHPNRVTAEARGEVLKKKVVCRDIRIVRTNTTITNPWTLSYKTVMERETEVRPLLLKKPERWQTQGTPKKEWNGEPKLRRRRTKVVSAQFQKPGMPTIVGLNSKT